MDIYLDVGKREEKVQLQRINLYEKNVDTNAKLFVNSIKKSDWSNLMNLLSTLLANYKRSRIRAQSDASITYICFPLKQSVNGYIYIYILYTKIQDSCKMSAEQDTLNNENISDQDHRTQTDSIHERFRPKDYYVYCDDCKSKIEPNTTAIQKHYKNESHPSNSTCRYCKGKVFTYRNILNDNDADNSLSRTYIFHRCKEKYVPKEESTSDESSR